MLVIIITCGENAPNYISNEFVKPRSILISFGIFQ